MYVDIYECVIDENFFFVSLDVESFVFDALRSSLPRDHTCIHITRSLARRSPSSLDPFCGCVDLISFGEPLTRCGTAEAGWQ